MIKKDKKYIHNTLLVLLWSVIILCFIFLAGYEMTNAHESAHQSICKYYNGEVLNSSISFDNGFTLCKVNATESYWESNSIVDAFGYQLQMMFMLEIMLLYFTVLIILLKK